MDNENKIKEELHTSLSWTPRGAVRQRPVHYEITSEEFKRVRQLASQEKQDTDEADNQRASQKIYSPSK